MSHDDVNGDLNRAVPGKGEFDDVRNTLRGAIPPLRQLENGGELSRDLWPEMLRRLERPQVRVPWFDWALLAVSGAVLFFFPGLIPALLYHL
ncbi:MAG TPA: hypothetical protein VM781_01450 [Candidatus Bathyarchaeia archaeon]|nr:hypothetical protein [Candidatus Bathyarchaeia archaeon]